MYKFESNQGMLLVGSLLLITFLCCWCCHCCGWRSSCCRKCCDVSDWCVLHPLACHLALASSSFTFVGLLSVQMYCCCSVRVSAVSSILASADVPVVSPSYYLLMYTVYLLFLMYLLLLVLGSLPCSCIFAIAEWWVALVWVWPSVRVAYYCRIPTWLPSSQYPPLAGGG